MDFIPLNTTRFIFLISSMCIMSGRMYGSQSPKNSDEKRCSAMQQVLPKVNGEDKDYKALLGILAHICQFPTVIGQEIIQYAFTQQHYEYNQMLTPERSDSEGYRHPYWITCFKLLSTQALAIGRNNGTIDIWNISNRKFKSLIGSHTINALTELNNGMLASAAQELIYIWDTKTGTYMHNLIGHTGRINALVFLQHRNLLISAANDKTIRIWSPVTRTCEGVIVSDGATATKALAILPNGSLISINTHYIQTWDINSLRSTQWLQTHHWGDYVDTLVLPGNILALSCTSKSSVRLWDMNTGLRTAKIPIKDRPTKLAYLGNQHLVVGCDNGTIVIIDTLTNKPIQTLTIPSYGHIKRAVPHAGRISGLEVLPDGRFTASLYDSANIHIFRPIIELTKPKPSRATQFVKKIFEK